MNFNNEPALIDPTINVETKLCPICNTFFSRPKGKSNKVWKLQVCCGKDCSAISRRKDDTPRRIKRRKDLNPGDRRYAGI